MRSDFPYLVERRLGSGASAEVWLAREQGGGKPLALKVGRDKDQAGRLASEARRLCSLESPTLARFVDAGFVPDRAQLKKLGLSAGLPFVATSWFPGEPLSAFEPDHAERFVLAATVARDIGDALEELHTLGWAHADIKPSNIVIVRDSATSKLSAGLVDLGLSAAEHSTTTIGGTPRYLAPEVFDNEPRGTLRTRDLWAFGLTLAEIVDDRLRAVPKNDVAAELEAPEPWGSLIRALLDREPFTRPPAKWVSSEARLVLNEPLSTVDDEATVTRRVKASYLALHQEALGKVANGARASLEVSGLTGQWLAEAVSASEKLAVISGADLASDVVFRESTGFDRRRWLVHLLGGGAAHFPVPAVDSDSALARRLIAAGRARKLGVIRYSDLLGSSSAANEAPLEPLEPLELVEQLASGACSPGAFEQARRQARLDTSNNRALTRVLARALGRQGEWAQARILFDELGGGEAVVQAAELSRRLGDGLGAERRLELLATLPGVAAKDRARAASIRARLAYDRGQYERASAWLDEAAGTTSSLEVRALVELATGNAAQAQAAVAELKSLPLDAGDSARAESILGSIEHASGEPRRALAAFRRAADHAARSGAWLEEATYLTNVASAAIDLGEFKLGAESAERSLLLFEHLGKEQGAARASLALVAIFSSLGVSGQARNWAREGLRRARASRDTRCEAYIHLARADAPDVNAHEAKEHADRAFHLLEKTDLGDELRALARRLKYSELGRELANVDVIAARAELNPEARLDWWGARIERLLTNGSTTTGESQRLLEQVLTLLASPLAVSCRGPNLSAAAELARREGQGELARRLVHEASLAARQFEQGAPESYRSTVSELPWVKRLFQLSTTPIHQEQVADIEQLVRSLGTRDGLRPLLNQVLDALVLWTGVERGLLLLKAPGGRLLPRAARNLARHDIAGLQLELSHTLAERALSERVPVVAIDATHELSELHHSVHVLGLRSVLAVPLIARGDTLGVVYLDDRTRRGAFGWDPLESTCRHASLSIL